MDTDKITDVAKNLAVLGLTTAFVSKTARWSIAKSKKATKKFKWL